MSADADIDQCAGATAILWTPPPKPSLIMTVGNDTSAYIGTLNGTDLITSLTDAINGVCLTGKNACSPTVATLAPITYPVPSGNGAGGLDEGYLAITLDHSTYQNDTMRDMLIAAIAAGVNQTLSRANACTNLTRKIDGRPGNPAMIQAYHACFTTGLIYVNYYSGSNVYGADSLMYARFSFGSLDGGAEVGMELCADCMVAADLADALLFWCVPCQAVLKGVNKAVTAVCNAVSDIHSAVSLATGTASVVLPTEFVRGIYP